MPRSSFLLLPALLLTLGFAPACDAEPRDAEERVLEAAPALALELDGNVAQEAFCDAYLEITCQANVDCCGRGDEAYASVDACKTATPCPLEEALSGALTRYDPAAAGAFLRAQAGAASTCDGPASSAALSIVGGIVSEDDDESEAASPADDAFCDDAVVNESASGPTDEASSEGPGDLEPRSAPSKLCVKAASNGTSGNITLDYQKGGSSTRYSCTLTGGLDSSEERCCTSYTTSTSSVTYAYPQMWVANDSSDGVKVDRVKVGSEQTHTFKDPGGVKCNDCFLSSFCDSCWVDKSGNGSCGRIRIDTDYVANADVACDE